MSNARRKAVSLPPPIEAAALPRVPSGLPAALAILPWLPTLAMALYLKFVLVEWDGFSILAQLRGLISTEALPLTAKASLFVADFLVAAQIVLLATLLAGLLKRAPLVLLIHSMLSMALSTCLFFQLQSYYQLGRFTSYPFLLAALSFVRENWSISSSYLSAASSAKFGILIAAIVFCTSLASWVLKKARLLLPFSAVWKLCLLFLLMLVAQYKLPQTSSYHRAAVTQALSHLIGSSPVTKAYRFYQARDQQSLLQDYKELVNYKVNSNQEYFAHARGFNVLIVVLETTPAQLLYSDFQRSAPALYALSQTAFQARAHYASYPISNRSLFSAFTAWYPSNSRRNFSQQHPDLQAPGLFRIARELGYESAFFSPGDLVWEDDRSMLEKLGIGAIYTASAPISDQSAQHSPEQTGEAEDKAALAMLLEQLGEWKARKQNFIAVFAPQLAHAPWPGEDNLSFESRARQTFQKQDALLATLVERVRALNQLESTLFVIFGDHGIRTRKEYAAFRIGYAEDISFRVPMILSNPILFPSARRSTTISSHIDITPSILELLGVSPGHPLRAYEQGTVLWSPELTQRKTFFFGQDFIGVDAMHHKGVFYMYSAARSRFCRSEHGLTFAPAECTHQTQMNREELNTMHSMTALQQAWVARFAP